MTFRAAAKTFDISVGSLEKRVSGGVGIAGRVGPGTVLSTAERNFIKDTLTFAAAYQLGRNRDDLKQVAVTLCSDNRPVPWDPVVGSGGKWLDLFLQRHPRLAERSSRIYEADRVIAEEEDRIREFYAAWQDYMDKEKPATDHIWNTDETSVSLSFKSPYRREMKKDLRHEALQLPRNVTVVATLNAADEVTPPLIIFRGQRVQLAWLNGGGSPGAWYASTESPFIQGPVFISYIKAFHRHILDTGKADGKPHVLMLDGHASHFTFEVIELAMPLNSELFQLPLHSSHTTSSPPCTFFAGSEGGLPRQQSEVNIQTFPRRNGGKMPVKLDMVNVIRYAFQLSFTPSQAEAYLQGAGLWLVDMHRALNRLRGRGSQRPALP
ncbi:unnamed protein product, partial [Sphacelaria rigidula]